MKAHDATASGTGSELKLEIANGVKVLNETEA
jgi:hypothetical protein